MKYPQEANENGFCKHCGADFDGGDIKQTFIAQGKTDEEAAEIASHYSGTKWGRQIGIYDLSEDRTVNTQCPDCKEMQS